MYSVKKKCKENDWFTESYYQNFNDAKLKHKVLKIEIESQFS